jgi:hypothetical protein
MPVSAGMAPFFKGGVMKLGFSGTQDGMTIKQRAALTTWIEDYFDSITHFRHGDCVGADAQAHAIVALLKERHGRHQGMYPRIVIHPCTIENKRAKCHVNVYNVHPAKPPLVRNKDIVDNSDVLIAAPKTATEIMRSGTWSTIRYARKMGKRVIILEP